MFIPLLAVAAACDERNDASAPRAGAAAPAVETPAPWGGVSVLAQDWTGIGAGEALTVGGRERFLREDFAELSVRVQIRNDSDEVVPAASAFKINTRDKWGAAGKALELHVIRGRSGPGQSDGPSEVAPKSTATVVLQSALTPLKELSGRQLTLGSEHDRAWSIRLNPVPPHDELFAGAACAHMLQWKVASQKWMGLAAGTSVQVREGQSRALAADVAGLALEFDVSNPTMKSLGVTVFAELLDNTGKSLRLAPVLTGFNPEAGPEVIAAGQTARLKFESKLYGYADVKSGEPLKLILPSKQSAIVPDPMPGPDVLYQNARK